MNCQHIYLNAFFDGERFIVICNECKKEVTTEETGVRIEFAGCTITDDFPKPKEIICKISDGEL